VYPITPRRTRFSRRWFLIFHFFFFVDVLLSTICLAWLSVTNQSRTNLFCQVFKTIKFIDHKIHQPWPYSCTVATQSVTSTLCCPSRAFVWATIQGARSYHRPPTQNGSHRVPHSNRWKKKSAPSQRPHSMNPNKITHKVLSRKQVHAGSRSNHQ
jgi:hypothetical protein